MEGDCLTSIGIIIWDDGNAWNLADAMVVIVL